MIKTYKPTIDHQKHKYFSLEWLEENGFWYDGCFSIVITERNTGKSTGGLHYLFRNKLVDIDNRIVIVRNSDKEMKEFINNFKADYQDSYTIVGNRIYTCFREEVEHRNGEISFRQIIKDMVGYCGVLGESIRMDPARSNDMKNVKYIICDEFNQPKNGLDGKKFMQFYTSFVRNNNKIRTLIIGNRDDISSPLIQELIIKVEVPTEYNNQVYVHYFLEDKEDEDFYKFAYIDIPSGVFNPENEKALWRKLGNQTSFSGYYNSRRFLYEENKDCRRLLKKEMDVIDWKYTFDDDVFLGVYNHVLFIVNDDRRYIREIVKPKIQYNFTTKYSLIDNTKYINLNTDDGIMLLLSLIKPYYRYKWNVGYSSSELKEDFLKIYEFLCKWDSKNNKSYSI